MLSKRIALLAGAIGPLLLNKKWKLVLAESCTGGQLAASITKVAGCSEWFEFSLVTYSNFAKKQFLGVLPEVIEEEGAVSEACVLHMLQGLMVQPEFLGIAVTGFAGPEGGTQSTPCGSVYIAWQSPESNAYHELYHFLGTRGEVMQQAVYYALRQAVLMSLSQEDWQRAHYFFALMSDDVNLLEECHLIALNAGLKLEQLEPKSNLHVTLSYLGQVSGEKLAQYQHLGRELSHMHFPMEFNGVDLSYWDKPEAYVYELEAQAKVVALAHHLDPKQNFKPHMTISKKAKLEGQNVNLGQIKLKGEFTHIALMASFHGVFYLQYGRWDL